MLSCVGFPVSLLSAGIIRKLDDVIRVVISPNRLWDDMEFKNYTRPNDKDDEDNRSEQQHADTENMVFQHPPFQEDEAKIQKSTEEAFKVCHECAVTFDSYAATYLADCAMNIRLQFADASWTQFQDLITQYTREINEFDGIPEKKDLGIIFVSAALLFCYFVFYHIDRFWFRFDSCALKRQFTPAPRRCLDELLHFFLN